MAFTDIKTKQIGWWEKKIDNNDNNCKKGARARVQMKLFFTISERILSLKLLM